jgi:hypothetical protein
MAVPKWLKRVIIHFLAFATVSVLHSEFMSSKLTKTPKEELKPFLAWLVSIIEPPYSEYGIES